MYILVEDVLKRAHVPPRQGVYVERKVMIQKIRNELYKLKDQDGCELTLFFAYIHVNDRPHPLYTLYLAEHLGL